MEILVATSYSAMSSLLQPLKTQVVGPWFIPSFTQLQNTAECDSPT